MFQTTNQIQNRFNDPNSFCWILRSLSFLIFPHFDNAQNPRWLPYCQRRSNHRQDAKLSGSGLWISGLFTVSVVSVVSASPKFQGFTRWNMMGKRWRNLIYSVQFLHFLLRIRRTIKQQTLVLWGSPILDKLRCFQVALRRSLFKWGHMCKGKRKTCNLRPCSRGGRVQPMGYCTRRYIPKSKDSCTITCERSTTIWFPEYTIWRFPEMSVPMGTPKSSTFMRVSWAVPSYPPVLKHGRLDNPRTQWKF